MNARDAIAGLILAGGLSRRMGGGDKALRLLGGQRILDRVVARIRPQVGALLLNANGAPARFGVDLPIVPDAAPDHPGPLAGLLAGMDHVARHEPQAGWVLSVPADCPFLPLDLVERLQEGLTTKDAAFAASGGRDHPVVGLFPVARRDELRRLLIDDGERRAGMWTRHLEAARVEWPDTPCDPFFNVNTPDEFAAAEAMLALHPSA